MGDARDRVTGKTELEYTSGYIWSLVEVAEISPKSGARNLDIPRLQTRN